ncbi:hypothetical protein AB0L33_18555 [Streptomyces sp. NPDC052299]|uniref:hypothetical protein n=1 Tax=Streptomyces sp. NPDC052299 TaxID=3155054 RepID=UPI003442105A
MDDSLSFGSFYRGAVKAAHRAMEDHGRREYDEFALHGGVAAERLAKAVLVSKHPTYLLETRNASSDMLLYLGGHLELESKKVRTVGALDAVKRVRRLGVLGADQDLDQLIELRNGTAHSTVGDEAKALLPSLAQNIETMLQHLGKPVDAFWGRWASAVNAAVDRQRSDVERDVQLRVRQARHLFEDRFKGWPGATQSKAKILGSGPSFSFYLDTTAPDADPEIVTVFGTAGCPGCRGTATVMVAPDPTANATDAALALSSLRCSWCQLELNGPEEISASGLDVEGLLEVATFALDAPLSPLFEVDDDKQVG